MSRPRPRVLALDFDGVIWDSAGECFEVAWRAYKELFGRDLSAQDYRVKFLGGRPHARTGHDFFIILRLLDEKPERDLMAVTAQQFLQLRTDLAEDAARFNTRFYQLRCKYRDEDFTAWSSWQGPYPEMIKLLERWESRFDGTALATTKDQASAHALLMSSGRDWPVFGKEFSLDKNEQLLGIAQRYGAEPQEVLFVDDLLENLQQVEPLGGTAAMAAWGYNTEESREEARSLGFPVVDVEGLEHLFEELLDEVRA